MKEKEPKSSFRSALLEQQLLVGSWIQIACPTSAEILSNGDFDWIGIDMEHSDIGMTELTGILRALHSRRAAPVVRVQTNDVLEIRKVLDLGAAGVLVPLVNSAEEATAAAAAAKYPPKGIRGYAFSRMNDWGINFEQYARIANHEVAVIVMIETKTGVEHVREIVAVDGVDAVFIGPYDMSGSYGVPGETDGQLVSSACSRVIDACKKAKKSVGLHVVKPTRKSVQKALDDGYNLVCLGVDVVFLEHGSRTAREMLASRQPSDRGDLYK